MTERMFVMRYDRKSCGAVVGLLRTGLSDYRIAALTGVKPGNRFGTKLPSGRVAEYSYVRYFFCNLSDDIRQIFIDHCGLLGVRVTQSNHRNLTVSHRNSTAILEELVGRKT